MHDPNIVKCAYIENDRKKSNIQQRERQECRLADGAGRKADNV
jgi:hypothetical protein